jgi:quercetin dioxygenase-like cupin family protein
VSEFADVNLSQVDGIWIKQMHFPKAGMIAQTHAHSFDHQTLVTNGRLRVTVGDDVAEYAAPQIIVIQAGALHRLEALEDHTVAYCIHQVRDDVPVVEGIPNNDLSYLA